MNSIYPPTNESEFYSEMKRIDAELSRKGVPIHARSMHACSMYAKKYRIPIVFGGESKSQSYTSSDVSILINQWYCVNYSKRMHINPIIGRGIVSIGGDLWTILIPRQFGTIEYYCSKIFEVDVSPTRACQNILQLIENFTESKANQLSSFDINQLFELFKNLQTAFNYIDNNLHKDLVVEAKSDLIAACEHALSNPPNYNQMMWSSAHSLEKILKSVLKEYGKTHSISDLCEKVNLCYNLNIPSELIENVSADPNLRYGSKKYNSEDAIKTYSSVMKVIHYLKKIGS